MNCLQNASKIHCWQSVNSMNCLQNANTTHCLQSVNSMNCLQNANTTHCLQSVNSMYCLQNANKMHCLQSVNSVCRLQKINRISVTNVQEDLSFPCMCLLKIILVVSLLFNKTVHLCSTLLGSTANDNAAAVYALSNYLRSLTRDVCIISRHAGLRGHQRCSSDSRRDTLHAWLQFLHHNSKHTHTHTPTHTHTHDSHRICCLPEDIGI